MNVKFLLFISSIDIKRMVYSLPSRQIFCFTCLLRKEHTICYFFVIFWMSDYFFAARASTCFLSASISAFISALSAFISALSFAFYTSLAFNSAISLLCLSMTDAISALEYLIYLLLFPNFKENPPFTMLRLSPMVHPRLNMVLSLGR